MSKREMISANCYKGRMVKADELVQLARESRSVYLSHARQRMPAAFLVSMQFSIVMHRINEGLYLVEKVENKKENGLVELAKERWARKNKKGKAKLDSHGPLIPLTDVRMKP